MNTGLQVRTISNTLGGGFGNGVVPKNFFERTAKR